MIDSNKECTLPLLAAMEEVSRLPSRSDMSSDPVEMAVVADLVLAAIALIAREWGISPDDLFDDLAAGIFRGEQRRLRFDEWIKGFFREGLVAQLKHLSDREIVDQQWRDLGAKEVEDIFQRCLRWAEWSGEDLGVSDDELWRMLEAGECYDLWEIGYRIETEHYRSGIVVSSG